MEFIKVEEFLKQNEAVQTVFIEWWKNNMSECDLIYNLKFNEKRCLTDSDIFNSKFKKELLIESTNIPLLVEGQLRQFIEDKTLNKTDCCLDANTYDINICEDNGFYIKKYEDIDSDLLQAYWKVAIEIAKSNV